MCYGWPLIRVFNQLSQIPSFLLNPKDTNQGKHVDIEILRVETFFYQETMIKVKPSLTLLHPSLPVSPSHIHPKS